MFFKALCFFGNIALILAPSTIMLRANILERALILLTTLASIPQSVSNRDFDSKDLCGAIHEQLPMTDSYKATCASIARFIPESQVFYPGMPLPFESPHREFTSRR
jgi:hypothetical protein